MSVNTDPHAINQANTPWDPPQGPWRPWSHVSTGPLTDKCKSATADQVRKLQAQLRERLAHVEAVHARRQSAGEALRTTEEKVLVELDKDAAEMSDGKAAEQAHAEAIAALQEVTETERLHNQRLQRTKALAEQAQANLDLFVSEHWQELSEELTPEANQVAERVRKITAEFEQQLAPLRQDWDAIWGTQAELIGRTEPLRSDDLPAPTDYAQPPVVSAEGIARVRQLTEPAPQPVAATG